LSLEIGMIGQIVIDTIHPFRGDVIHDLGGLTYSIMAMDAMMEENDRMIPMTRVGKDALGEVKSGLEEVSHLSWEWVIEDDGPNNRVELRYVDAENREERVTGGVQPLAPEDIPDLAGLDALLVDLVSGREVEPGILSGIDGGLDIPVHLDLHSYLLDYDGSGKHYWRCPEGWEAWLDICDTLQVNRRELFTIAGVGDRVGIFEVGAGIWRSIRGGRVSALLVTDGDRGSWCWYGNDKDSGRVSHIPTVPMEDIVDPTGSGDVYGAAFFISRLRGQSIERSMIAATHFAGYNCAHSGTRCLNRHLERVEARSGKRFGRI
jgi:sugar/nucleoside kinase (ribokinase family)